MKEKSLEERFSEEFPAIKDANNWHYADLNIRMDGKDIMRDAYKLKFIKRFIREELESERKSLLKSLMEELEKAMPEYPPEPTKPIGNLWLDHKARCEEVELIREGIEISSAIIKSKE